MKNFPSLGATEVRLLSTLEHDERDVFSIEEAQAVLASSSHQVVRNVLSKLAAKGRIARIRRGLYLLVPFRHRGWAAHELSLVPLLAHEGYVSFASALRFWGLSDQLGTTVTVAVRRPVRERAFQGTTYRFASLADRYFFGFACVALSGRRVRVARREKAVLDSLLRPRQCLGIGEVARAVRDHHGELEWGRVAAYLRRMRSRATERRMRYILHHLGLGGELDALGESEHAGSVLLDPGGRAEGAYDRRFGVRVNVDLDEAMA